MLPRFEARPGTEPDLSSGYFCAQWSALRGQSCWLRSPRFPTGMPQDSVGASTPPVHELSPGGALDACVVAGVDSYLAPDTLDWLEKNPINSTVPGRSTMHGDSYQAKERARSWSCRG